MNDAPDIIGWLATVVAAALLASVASGQTTMPAQVLAPAGSDLSTIVGTQTHPGDVVAAAGAEYHGDIAIRTPGLTLLGKPGTVIHGTVTIFAPHVRIAFCRIESPDAEGVKCWAGDDPEIYGCEIWTGAASIYTRVANTRVLACRGRSVGEQFFRTDNALCTGEVAFCETWPGDPRLGKEAITVRLCAGFTLHHNTLHGLDYLGGMRLGEDRVYAAGEACGDVRAFDNTFDGTRLQLNNVATGIVGGNRFVRTNGSLVPIHQTARASGVTVLADNVLAGVGSTKPLVTSN